MCRMWEWKQTHTTSKWHLAEASNQKISSTRLKYHIKFSAKALSATIYTLDNLQMCPIGKSASLHRQTHTKSNPHLAEASDQKISSTLANWLD